MTMLLDHPTISGRYFYPAPARLPETFWVEASFGRLACYYHRPHRRARTLVHFHGNGETVADYVPWLPEQLAAFGVNVFLSEYRGYGESDGEPALAAMLDDVEPIFESLALPEEEIVVFGRSVGSIYAIEFVNRYPSVRGLVLESGIADVLERVLLRVDPAEIGATREALDREASEVLNHRQKLSSFTGRLLIMHAQHDHLIDISHAERNHEYAANADRQMVVFPEGDHNSIFVANVEEYLARLKAWLDG
jgi:pimeloyl-ACP methyl ester carboxylesterase